ncbi:hypothetical protein DM793_03910 [Paenarthrobacter nitroguajacolicus]|nr:hypothetical protein [Paenarthrobacter nitroguajacolicus]
MTTAGLLIFVFGLIILAMARFILPVLTRSFRARNPNSDSSKHDRFQRTYALAFASLFLLTGLVLFVVGLANGGSIRFGT